MLEKDSFFPTQVSLVSPELRGDIPALRGNLPETSGEGTEVVLDRKKVSLRSTELRLERTEDRWTATQRRIEGAEIARVSPGVFWHPAHAALFSTGGVSDRTNLRGDATKRLRAPTSFLVERQLHLKISFLNNTNAKKAVRGRLFQKSDNQPKAVFNWPNEKTTLQRAMEVISANGLLVHIYGKLAVACLELIF
ncbi:hypothetical protein [Tannerella forsythia]|uniref:hypothetical protein n=1 Tax=Tannerella forsythia TaxID=28112 RepID=UPI00163B28E2|nr:hypothetical protein [Tannerella forsythia]